MWNKFYSSMLNIKQQFVVKDFIIITLVLFAIVSPLLAGNVYYQDDYHRLVSGNVSYWINNGRPLATWLTWFINFTRMVSDTSPLSLLLGILGLAASLVISFSRLTKPGAGFTILMALAIMLSPFISQSMLYAYDAMGILLSIGLAFLASMLYYPQRIRHFIISFILFLAALCLYQTSINYSFINILLIVMLAITQKNNTRKALRHAAIVLVALLIALLVYKLIVVPLCVTDTFNQTRSIMVPVSATGLGMVSHNLMQSMKVLLQAFPGYGLLPVSVIFIVGACGCYKTGFSWLRNKNAGSSRYLAASFSFIAPCLVLLTIGGFLLLLKDAEFYPRVMGAFSAALVFNFYIAHQAFPKLKVILNFCLVMYLLFTAVFMMATFRALVNQSNFDQTMVISMSNDLARVGSENISQVAIIGKSPLSPDILPAIKHYPLLNEIIYPSIEENFDFRYYALMNRAMAFYPFATTTPEIKAYIPTHIISAGCLYHFYMDGKTAIFNFQAPDCKMSSKFL
ncbi:MAG: glucosyltransferase domain-containing protein [Rouxiella aceris]|uniref:glucosyltransferase domain-containing protein n=1 Tax=Rouxiella aceris TaxID=2703884 RepID=UPI00284A8368|nr:glucosyltransferase domain-containing protein [Rouxiella aceris]MDR3431620.1 glucosyltransferase domain-containing protein [Rouxiella aceris]